MNALWQDLKHGLRVLFRNPGFTAVAILSLALGIGANTTIFTVVNAVLLNPLPVQDSSRLVEVDTVDSRTSIGAPNSTKLGMSYPNYRDYRDRSTAFAGLSIFTFTNLTISGQDKPKQVAGMMVSANYFDVLGIKPALGRTFYSDEDQKPGANNVAVLSYSLWRTQFGSDTGIIGRNLTLNGFSYTVVGVAPRNFKGTDNLFPPEQIWIPVSMYKQATSGEFTSDFNERRALLFTIIGRLKPGISLTQAEASLKPIASALEKEYPIDNAGRSVALTLLSDAATGGPDAHAQVALAGALIMGVVGLVLLIACVNLANLLLAQAAKRDREMSLRAALGAKPSRLLRQMLTESVTLSLLGGAAGMIVAYWSRNVLWSFRPPFLQQNSVNLEFDRRVLLFTLGISVFTGLLFGIAPALRVARVNLAESLKSGGRSASFGFLRNGFRSVLVAGELALALVALVRRRPLRSQHAAGAENEPRL